MCIHDKLNTMNTEDSNKPKPARDLKEQLNFLLYFCAWPFHYSSKGWL